MATRPAAIANEDFDPKDLIKVVTEHDEMRSRLDNLEKPESFTETFCKVSIEHTKIQDCLTKTFINLLQRNEECRNEIRGLVEGIDKRNFKSVLLKFAGWVGYAAFYLLGLITTGIVNKFFNAPTSPSH